MNRYSLKIAYVGTNYHGYQKQPAKQTIEDSLLDALTRINIKIQDPETKFQTAGRTDRGVHALGQTIAFTTSTPVIIPKLNKALPTDIKCWAKTVVDIKFNPRYAKSRSYLYAAPYQGENLKRIKDATALLIGKHDFRYFSVSAPGKTTIREMLNVRVKKVGNLLFFIFKAKSFLWKMIRKIVSALLSVGKDEMSLDVFKSILTGSTSKIPGIAPAPPEGLILFDVDYDLRFEVDKVGVRQTLKLFQKLLNHHLQLQGVYSQVVDSLKAMIA